MRAFLAVLMTARQQAKRGGSSRPFLFRQLSAKAEGQTGIVTAGVQCWSGAGCWIALNSRLSAKAELLSAACCLPSAVCRLLPAA